MIDFNSISIPLGLFYALFIGQAGRVFANGPGGRDSIIPKTQKNVT